MKAQLPTALPGSNPLGLRDAHHIGGWCAGLHLRVESCDRARLPHKSRSLPSLHRSPYHRYTMSRTRLIAVAALATVILSNTTRPLPDPGLAAGGWLVQLRGDRK